MQWGQWLHAAIARLRLSFGRARGLRTAFLAILLMAAATVAGVLSPLNDLMYDAVSEVRVFSSVRPAVLLLEIPFGMDGRRIDWATLCQRVEQSGARSVVITIPLANLNADYLMTNRCAKVTVVGVRVAERDGDESATVATLQRLEAAGLEVGLLPSQFGPQDTHRVPLAYRLGDRRWPSLFATAAMSQQRRELDEFIPDLRRPPESIPAVSLQRVLDDGVVPEVGRDRVVLIGYASDPMLQTVAIPGRRDSVSLLRFQGLVVDAMLGGASIFIQDSGRQVAALVLIALIFVVSLQPLPLRSGMMLLLMTCLAEGLLGMGMLGFFGVWIPLSEVFVLEAMIFLGVYRSKATEDGKQLRAVLGAASQQLQKRTRPPNFLQTEEHWTFVIRLVDQTLLLNRTIFLDRVVGDHRLKEIVALRCSIADIGEPRRDYERTPYTTAIGAGGMIEVDNYLKNSAPGERQFLTPLIFGGEVMGFWAFGIGAEACSHTHDLAASVNAIAEQVARLLYQRKAWQDDQSRADNRINTIFEDGTQAAYRELGQSVLLMEQRLTSLEDIFTHQTNAAILYDLFGRVVLINTKMSDLVAPAGISPYSLTVTDFLAQLAARPGDRIRPLMRNLIMERQTFSLPVEMPVATDRKFLLKVNALSQDEENSDSAEKASPFRLSGVLVELIDVTEADVAMRTKTDLLTLVGHKLANHVESIMAAAYLIDWRETPLAERERARQLLAEATAELPKLIDSATRLLARESATTDVGSFPINPMRPLAMAAKAVESALAERQLRFEHDVPSFASLVVIDPAMLKKVFVVILKFLAEDAATGTVLSMEIMAWEGELHLLFRNEGFGIPAERLREFLDSSRSGERLDRFHDLRQARQLVAEGGGSLEFASEIGQGSKAGLHLPLY